MKKIISTPEAPAAIGPYSQGTVSGNFVFTSGQLPLVPETGAFPGDDVESQTHQAIKNLKAVLEAAGASLNSVLKTTVFISDIKNFGEVNSIYSRYFTENFPARSCFEVSALPKGALLEIEAVAVKE